MQLQMKIGKIYYPIANPQHTILLGGQPSVGKSRLIEPIIGSFLSKTGQASMFKWEGDRSKRSVILVETEQPEDLVQAARERIQRYSKLPTKEFDKRFITIPLSEVKGGLERRDIIKQTVNNLKTTLGLIILDNLTGVVNNVNSEVEATDINHLISGIGKSTNSISILISHLTNSDKSPLGHVGKYSARDCSSHFNLLKDDFNGITFIKRVKNRLEPNIPDYHFTVNKGQGDVVPGVYLPFP